MSFRYTETALLKDLGESIFPVGNTAASNRYRKKKGIKSCVEACWVAYHSSPVSSWLLDQDILSLKHMVLLPPTNAHVCESSVTVSMLISEYYPHADS